MVLAPSRGIPFTIKIDDFNRESNASRGCKNHQATLRATRSSRRRFCLPLAKVQFQRVHLVRPGPTFWLVIV